MGPDTYAYVLIKWEVWTQRHTYSEGSVKRVEIGMRLLNAKELQILPTTTRGYVRGTELTLSALRRNKLCQHFAIGFLASRIVR